LKEPIFKVRYRVVGFAFERSKQLTDEKIREAAAFGLKHVESIGFDAQERLTPGGMAVLLEQTPNLRSFSPSGTSDRGVHQKIMALVRPLRKLEQIRFSGWGDDWAGLLSEMPSMRAVETWRSGMTLAGVQSLAKLPNLTRLDIGDEDNMPKTAMPVLAGMKNLTQMRLPPQLHPEVHQLAGLKGLKLLHLPKTKLSEQEVQALREKMPWCKIVTVLPANNHLYLPPWPLSAKDGEK
jgi:hypothetical protein